MLHRPTQALHNHIGFVSAQVAHTVQQLREGGPKCNPVDFAAASGGNPQLAHPLGTGREAKLPQQGRRGGKRLGQLLRAGPHGAYMVPRGVSGGSCLRCAIASWRGGGRMPLTCGGAQPPTLC